MNARQGDEGVNSTRRHGIVASLCLPSRAQSTYKPCSDDFLTALLTGDRINLCQREIAVRLGTVSANHRAIAQMHRAMLVPNATPHLSTLSAQLLVEHIPPPSLYTSTSGSRSPNGLLRKYDSSNLSQPCPFLPPPTRLYSPSEHARTHPPRPRRMPCPSGAPRAC